MMNEGYINAGMQPLYSDPYNLTDAMGNSITTGTDWQDELFNDNAPVMNHDVTISGASDKVNYYLSMGYYEQEGIIGGNFDRSNYQRLSLRSNTKYNLFDVSKERNWLNKLDVTVNLSYARVKSKSIDANSQWGSPLGSALSLSPILTPTLTGAAADAQDEFYRQTQPDYPGPILSPNGDPYTIAGTTYNEMVNPLASLSLPGAQNWSHKFVTNFAAELQLWDGLKYRISYGADMSFWGNGLSNPDLKWEESEQTDIGLDFGFMNNALTFTVDYYKKRTNGMLMTMAIPSYVGETKPIGNVGKMENSGVEFELGYKFNVADAQFSIRGNASYLHNELIELGNDTGWAAYDSFQGVGTITRAMNGEPFPYFYGLKTAGIFQTQEEIDSYVGPDGKTPIQPDAKPGYVRFVDLNNDGVIDDNDRTKIGKGMPDWTFGVNFSAAWRGFDFNMMWQGTAGNDVFDATRRIDINSSNLPSWMLNRWTGPGTSDKYPIFIVGDSSDNWKSSDLYVYDGSYLRLKNIELGYTLPANLTKAVFINRLRVYVSAENLLTFTKYHGFDPEISSGGTSLGVDYGVYPQARVWRIGFNLEF